MATNCRPHAPAATFRCRLAPTIPQVAFHAVRELDRLSYGAAQIRWAQAGFLPRTPPGETPRNLMGFKDGTINPPLGARSHDAR